MRSTIVTLFGVVALGWLATTGNSRAECVKAYTGEELIADLGTMTTSLRSLDEAAFKASGQRLEASLACAKTPVPTPVFASAYRFIGAYHFLAGREPDARRWFRTAIELDPNFEWDINELDLGHPLRNVFDEERSVASDPPSLLEGKVINVPAGSMLMLDGRKLSQPEATLDRPHLLQVVGQTDKSVRQVFVIEGNAIPEQFLIDEALAMTTPEGDDAGKKGKKGKKGAPEKAYGDYDVQVIQRVRPPAKTPLIVTGGLVLFGSGVVYSMSFASRNEFEKATTTDDLERYRTVTNTLIIASGATFAVGMGVGYAGMMLDGGPGLTFGGRF